MTERLTLLTIDDEEPIRRSIRVFFEDSDFEVLEARDGSEGLTIFRKKRPAVVLVDLRMPGISGLEVIHALAKEAPEIPVVVLSGTGYIGDAIEAIRRGAWDYVTKPIADMAELHHVVKNVLERARLLEENRRYREGLEEEVARRTRELTEINDRLREMARSTRAFTVCASIGEAARQLLEVFAFNMAAEGGSFYMVENGRLVLKYALDPGHAAESLPLPLPTTSVLGKAMAEKAAVLIRDIDTDKTVLPCGWKGYRDGSLLAFPFVDSQGQPLGVVTLHNKNDPPFTEQDREIGIILASYSCEAIRGARAMELLHKSEEKFRAIVETTNEWIWSIDLKGIHTYSNPAGENILGYKPEEIVGKPYQNYLHPEDREKSKYLIEEMIREKKGWTGQVLRWKHKNGADRYLESNTVPILDEKGKLQGILGADRDITDKKRAEQNLETKANELAVLNSLGREMRSHLSIESAVETALDHIITSVGPDVTMLFLRHGADLVLAGCLPAGGVPRDKEMPTHRVGECLCGLAVSERKAVYSSNIRSDLRCTWEECREAGLESAGVLPLLSGDEVIGVLAMASRSGRNFQEQTSFLDALSNEIAIGLKNAILYEKAQADATELQTRLMQIHDAEKEKEKLTAQLRQAQKMEAIGTLAGGIAHDFNNILSAILGYAELASFGIGENDKVKYYLEQSMLAASRAKDLVQQILTFSRQTKQELKPLNIKPIVKEGLKFLRASLPSTIEIREDIEEELGTIEADSTQVHQVLMNLCTNAAHAMEKNGGALEVSLSKLDIKGETSSAAQEIEPGSYVRLRVTDTGHGMHPEILERIFDPYYTTKEGGKGTGLGLAVVHGIVKSYGGAITVSSEVGKGSTFDIYFPRIGTVDFSSKGEEGEPLPLGGHERVLFVDDEEGIVEVGREILEYLGYEVVAKTSSTEALELFRGHADRFDLVITDMTMPNMTGDKLAQELIRIRPEIPIIICTGFSEHITEEKAKTIGIREFAMKPLVIRDLAKAIRRALDDQGKKKN
jgi:PAS domain S-box-containing protein